MNEPFYVRWTPINCPYALELRLDLIARLKSEMNQAELTGVEMGGVFFGALPTNSSPTLRLSDLIIVPGDPARKEFSLDPAQVKQLANMSAEARATGRPFTGFFRISLQKGELAPTSEDRQMLAPQFPARLYAFLIIGRRALPPAPHEGAFFLAMGGQLSEAPSCPPFVLEEGLFQQLPELPEEAMEDVPDDFAKAAPRRPMPWPALFCFALVVFLIGTWTLGSRLSAMFRPDSNQIDLIAVKFGKNLKITWDHSSPLITRAHGATLIIMDGSIHRELKLDTDDLKLGQISYERISKNVLVVMSLDTPGTKLPAQTFNWSSD